MLHFCFTDHSSEGKMESTLAAPRTKGHRYFLSWEKLQEQINKATIFPSWVNNAQLVQSQCTLSLIMSGMVSSLQEMRRQLFGVGLMEIFGAFDVETKETYKCSGLWHGWGRPCGDKASGMYCFSLFSKLWYSVDWCFTDVKLTTLVSVFKWRVGA